MKVFSIKMLKILAKKLQKNFEIAALLFLIFITFTSTSYYNYKKKITEETYNNFIDNIYFKKTLSHIVEGLDPKYKKIKHKIKSGETFDKILNNYKIEKTEINKIKDALKKKS